MSLNESKQSILQTVSNHLYAFKRHHPDVRIDFTIREMDIPGFETILEVIFRRYNYSYARCFTITEFCILKDWTTRFDDQLNEMYEAVLKGGKTDEST